MSEKEILIVAIGRESQVGRAIILEEMGFELDEEEIDCDAIEECVNRLTDRQAERINNKLN